MTDLSRALAMGLAQRPWSEVARPSQVLPAGGWRIWLLLGGRGAGKTRSASENVSSLIRAGNAHRIAVVARTAADVRDVCIEGPSGLLAVAPDWFRPDYEPSKRRLAWPNGAVATTFSSDEPDALRGPQHDLAWVDELATFEHVEELWSNLLLGLRLGQARCIVTTTPRPIPLIRTLVARHGQDVVVSKMTTFENLPNLSTGFAQDIVSKYAGTTIGRQELYAEILTDVPGALWTREMLEKTRVAHPPMTTGYRHDGSTVQVADLQRICVAVDPSVSATAEGAAECGIIVAGVDRQRPLPHAYVLADESLRASPDTWARRVVTAYRAHRADRVVAEINQGGELVRKVLQTVDSSLPLTTVHASRSKQARAEPVAALYEQGRVHHVGLHAELEEQLCGWVPGEGESPDRLDALTWSIWSLLLRAVSLSDRLASMTPAEKEAYFARQRAAIADAFRI